jgi:hypothetical protein
LNELLDVAATTDEEPEEQHTYDNDGENDASTKRQGEKPYATGENVCDGAPAHVICPRRRCYANSGTKPKPKSDTLGFE